MLAKPVADSPAAESSVWILAASTGGIEAVTRFLSLVPRAEHVALVYVQHIDEHQHAQLMKIVERHCDWPVRGVDYGSSLKGGWVTIPAADERFDIDDEGLMGIAEGDGWRAPYRPNVDDVAEQISGYYGARTGLIVFTGMGNDGCRGGSHVAQAGGNIWVQSPATCAAVSMPEAVLGAVPCSQVGSIEMLAQRFTMETSLDPHKRASGE